MTTWEEIRDEIAGMLADGEPLENVIAKLEKRKNEMAKANIIAVMDEMKKSKPVTNFENITKSEESLAEWLALSGYGSCVHYDCDTCEFYDKKLDDCIDGWDISHEKKRWVEWLKQPHT